MKLKIFMIILIILLIVAPIVVSIINVSINLKETTSDVAHFAMSDVYALNIAEKGGFCIG